MTMASKRRSQKQLDSGYIKLLGGRRIKLFLEEEMCLQKRLLEVINLHGNVESIVLPWIRLGRVRGCIGGL